MHPSTASSLARRSRGTFAITSLLLVLPIVSVSADSAERAAGRGAESTLQSLPALAARAHEALAIEFDAAIDARIEIASLDTRLRLPACAKPLFAEPLPPRSGHGRRTVEVACPGKPAWRVRVNATVDVTAEVWTLARAVRRGELLTRELLVARRVSLGPRDGQALRVAPVAGASRDAVDGLIGHQFLRSVPADKTLDAGVLAPPTLVERGRRLRILHGGAGVAIAAVGTALADARLGERVSVRNEASGRTLDAVVTARDEVRIR